MMSWNTGPAVAPPPAFEYGLSSTTYVRNRGLSAGANPMNDTVFWPRT
jgi:hypothetical protein